VPLDTTSRGYFEPRFGCDFANIRIHRGTQAAAAAASIQARAFALGRDLVFAAGEYEPQSADGRRLLAHELTHVVQQSGVKGIRGADKPGSSQGRYEYFHLGKVSPEKIYRAEPQPTPSSLPFERVGNEAGIAGAKGAAERLERLVIGTTVARALATIPITDAAQKRVVIQHVQNSPATLRAIAEQDKVRFLSQQEYETGIEFLGFPSGADAFADSKNGFLYITPHGTPSAFTMGHEVSHIQTGPVGGDSADPAFSIALGNLNLEIRAAFVDYAILKLATLHENLAAGMTEEQAVAGFAQVYSSTILDYIVDHGSVESTLGKLAKEVSRRRSVEHVPQNIDELKKAVAKGYVSEADLVLIFSPEAPEIEHYVEPFEIEGL
jgi:hypothetical protein